MFYSLADWRDAWVAVINACWRLAGRVYWPRTIGRLSPQVPKLVLNTNGDEARFKSFALPIVKDTMDDFAGPLAGILAGMRWTQQEAPGASHIVTIASDTPLFPS